MSTDAPLTPYGVPCICGENFTAGQICTLSQDQQISGADCFDVNADNVTIDCAGHSITGDDTGGTTGISSQQFNTTIENCNISGFQYGVYFNTATVGAIDNTSASTTSNSGDGIIIYSSSNIAINNSAATSPSSAIYIWLGSNNTISGTAATATSQYAIDLSSSSNNTVANTIANASGGNYAIYLSSSSSNTIANTTAMASAYAIYLNSGSDYNAISNANAIASGGAIGVYSSSYNVIANTYATAPG